MRSRFAGIFFLLIGAFGIFLGVSLLLGNAAPTAGNTCKTICGITLLAAAVFGDVVGQVVGGILWFVAGLGICSLGIAIGGKPR